MNIKVVAVLCICALVAAEAKPGRGKEKGKGKGSDSNSADTDANLPVVDHGIKSRIALLVVTQLQKLCDGLNDGSITNTNSSYDDVFTAFADVCTELNSLPSGRKRRGDSSDSSESSDDDNNGQDALFPGNEALTQLFSICRTLERILANLPASLSTAVVSVLNNTGAVCVLAENVLNPVTP